MATMQKDKTDPRQQMGSSVQSFADQAKDMAEETANKAKELAGEAAAKVKEGGATVTQKAGEAASLLGKKADDATCSVGAGMKNLAGSIREHTQGGTFGSAGEAVAETLESSGRYLQEQGLKGIGDDLTKVIRRNPIPALLIAVGIGFLTARALSSRS